MVKGSVRVSLQTARLALTAVALVGLAGLVTVFTIPVGPPPAPVVAAAKTAEVIIPAPARPAAAPVTMSASPASYTVTSFLPRPAAFEHGSWIWNDEGAPAGPMLVVVDVQTQLIHVFRAGREIGVAVVMYGADDSPTPLGIHPIRWKDADHKSSIFGSSMPYTMNLTGDGVAIHGSNVRWGWGTNGCVGVPVPFAKLLFEQVKPGDKVVIVKGKTPQPGQSVPTA